MTISVDEATSLARDLVRKIGESAGEKLSIMEEKAITIEGGWVFFIIPMNLLELAILHPHWQGMVRFL